MARVTITRRHHPFEGETFEVVKSGPRQIVIRVDDGSSMRVPRSWTDADGPPRAEAPEHVFTVDALRELGALVVALAQRSSAEVVPRSDDAVVVESGKDGSA